MCGAKILRKSSGKIRDPIFQYFIERNFGTRGSVKKKTVKNRDIKKLFKWKIWKKGTACLLVFSVLLQTVTVSAQGIAKGPPIDMQLIQQLQEAKMPMQSDVSEEGQIVQSSGEQSELTENGQTDQPSGDQSGSAENGQAVSRQEISQVRQKTDRQIRHRISSQKTQIYMKTALLRFTTSNSFRRSVQEVLYG